MDKTKVINALKNGRVYFKKGYQSYTLYLKLVELLTKYGYNLPLDLIWYVNASSFLLHDKNIYEYNESMTKGIWVFQKQAHEKDLNDVYLGLDELVNIIKED